MNNNDDKKMLDDFSAHMLLLVLTGVTFVLVVCSFL